MDSYKKQFLEFVALGRITKSPSTFKIKLFLKKRENSLLVAKHIKDIKPGKGEPEATPQETAQTLNDVDQLFVNGSEVEIGEMI